MRYQSVRCIILSALAASFVVFAASEGVSVFTSKRAKEAEKTYSKAMERINAEYETKVTKARTEYLKALETALKETKKAKDSAAEAERISKAIEALKREAASPAKGAPAKAPEKIGSYTFTLGDGESLEQAIVIGGAGDSGGAVDAEHLWLEKHLPKYKQVKQSLVGREGRKFDVIELKGPGGDVKKIHFDITDCFGFPKGE